MSYKLGQYTNVFLRFSDAIETLMDYIKNGNGLDLAKQEPKSKFIITEVVGVFETGQDYFDNDTLKYKKMYSLTSKEVIRLNNTEFGFAKGGSVSDLKMKLEMKLKVT